MMEVDAESGKTVQHRVVVLALDGVYPFELGVPDRIFGGVGEHYLVQTASASPDRRVKAHPDIMLELAHGPEALTTADTVVIPPYDLDLFTPDLPEHVASALKGIRQGARVVSLCTAAFTLAAAGMLDGRRATTHWAVIGEFRQLFPQVRLDPDVLFVDEGDLLSSAGVASAIDVCLHMVRTDLGSSVANRVARQCVTPPWREGGQAQYIRQPLPEFQDQGTGATRQWVLDHLSDSISLADMARHARMSQRTFTRHFENETGTTPGRWLTLQRLDRAKDLLENTEMSIERIALDVGFAGGASLRSHFQSSIGVTPREYRSNFSPPEGT